jgi:hypothetical protein
MKAYTDLRNFWRLYQITRRRYLQLVDELGYGYSRTDTDTTDDSPIPQGVDLYHFTGRTRMEGTR